MNANRAAESNAGPSESRGRRPRAPSRPSPLRALAGACVLATLYLVARAAAADLKDYLQLATVSYEQDYSFQNYKKAESVAKEIVEAADAARDAKVEAYKTLCCVHLSRREETMARDTVAKMLALDPSARFSPEGRFPRVASRLYNEVRDSLDIQTIDIRTVAIGDFENNSVYTGKFKGYDYDMFRPALVHTIITDLSAATGLKIVDRQRVAQLEDEVALGPGGFASPGDAVKAGRFLGAHTYVFGQYMILDKKRVRIDIRVDNTATTEILIARQITGEFGGNADKFLDLEKALVMEIAAALDSVAAGADGGGAPPVRRESIDRYFQERRDEVRDQKNYAKARFQSGEAVLEEEQGDLAAALSLWKTVLKGDPKNADAALHTRILEAAISASESIAPPASADEPSQGGS